MGQLRIFDVGCEDRGQRVTKALKPLLKVPRLTVSLVRSPWVLDPLLGKRKTNYSWIWLKWNVKGFETKLDWKRVG